MPHTAARGGRGRGTDKQCGCAAASAGGVGARRKNEGCCRRTRTTNGTSMRDARCEPINWRWKVHVLRSMSGLPIEKALRAADEALERAQRELSSGSVVDKVNEEGEAEPPANSTDPDGDLAAAFFAAQAKKQGAENRLPATEWAQLFPGLRLQVGCPNTSVTQQSEEMKSLIKEQLVERLHQEYKKESADK